MMFGMSSGVFVLAAADSYGLLVGWAAYWGALAGGLASTWSPLVADLMVRVYMLLFHR